jgi:recombination protein RecT
MSTNALRAAVTGQDQKPEDRKTIRHYLQDPRVQAGLKAVAGKYMPADRILKFVINAVERTPKLAECEPRSVLGGMMLCTAFQLEPNTPQQLAFLIPYARNVKVGGQWRKIYECQFQIGARGFRLLAHRSGLFERIISRTVRDGDLFEYMEGSQTFLKYAKSTKGRGEILVAFSHAMYKGGGESALVLPWDELEKIRSKSETYRSLRSNLELADNEKDRAKAQAAFDDQPWIMWVDDMCEKSATKKHAKEWPITGADPVLTASTVDDAADTGTIDLSQFADAEQTRAVVEGGDEPPKLENKPSPAIEEPAAPVVAAAVPDEKMTVAQTRESK